MQENIFLFLTIAFVATSTSQGYVPHAKPEHSSAMTAPLASVSATNESSLEEILQELGVGTSRRNEILSGCQFSRGPFGGGGGRHFNELPDECRAIVRRIIIRSGSRVDSIHITYKFSNGNDHTADKHGGDGGSPHIVEIHVDRGERLIGVFGRSGNEVDQLGFITSWGRIFGPYGGCGGSQFHVNSCLLRGIFGRSGSRIDAIGFLCGNYP